MVAKKRKSGKPRLSTRASKRPLFLMVFGGLALVLGGFLLYGNITMYLKRSSLNQKADELSLRMEALSAKEQGLKEAQAREQTAAYQEKILREQGLYKKRGEEVVTVIQDTQGSTENREPSAKEDVPRPRLWWDPLTW
ncbi:MAG: hypothetical protein HYW98_00810 [Candidatus Wildermuthbacteria bacterium]|nr:hypothetical protein [Candidatus Wildermuthbacteria bacterium]